MKTRYINDATVIAFPEDLLAAAPKRGKSDAKWFEVKNVTDQSADIYLYDEITAYLPDTSAKGVIAQLSNLKDVPVLNVRINSPGGSVFEGMAIYNALARHPGKVVVHVDGIAASIASVIAMAGKEIHIAENSMMMIHNPMAITMGEAKDLRKQADVLDQIKETIINIYTARTGRTRDKLANLMDDETWFTAQEAIDAKFADKTVKAMKVAANFNFSDLGYAKAPQPPKAEPTSAPTPENSTTSPSRLSNERRLALLELEAKQ